MHNMLRTGDARYLFPTYDCRLVACGKAMTRRLATSGATPPIGIAFFFALRLYSTHFRRRSALLQEGASMNPHVSTPAFNLRTSRFTPRPLLRIAVPRLSVVVVNYRSWHDTAQLVQQMLRSPALRDGEAEIVVVDNQSPPHPLARRLRRLSGVSLRHAGGTIADSRGPSTKAAGSARASGSCSSIPM